MPLTQTQLAAAVAERADMSNAEAKRALAALDEVVREQVADAERVRIGSLVQLAVRVKPAQKAARAETRPPARRSRSPPNRRASTCAPERLPERRRRCRPCRRLVAAWPRKPVFATRLFWLEVILRAVFELAGIDELAFAEIARVPLRPRVGGSRGHPLDVHVGPFRGRRRDERS